MAPIPWSARAAALISDQPATLAGLTAAVAAAAESARALPVHDDPAHDEPAHTPQMRIQASCAAARACLEHAAPRMTVPAPEAFEPPPAHPGPALDLEPVLRACIGLAADLLDNDDEPLGFDQVIAIGQAVAHLDNARRHCREVAP